MTGRTQAETTKTEPLGWYRYALQWIVDEAVDATPQGGVWVEVGVGVGRGIAYMARQLIIRGRHDVTLYAVDPWGGTGRCGQQQEDAPPSRHGDWVLFLNTMLRHAPTELHRINVLRCTSIEASAMFDEGDVDLCIIDGAHDYEHVANDMFVWGQLSRIIGGDDCTAGSDVERAVLERWPDVERRGNPHSKGDQHDWPTFRKVLR